MLVNVIPKDFALKLYSTILEMRIINQVMGVGAYKFSFEYDVEGIELKRTKNLWFSSKKGENFAQNA